MAARIDERLKEEEEKQKAKKTKKSSSSKVVKTLELIEQELTQKDDYVEPPWIKTAKADGLFGLVIMGNAAFIGIDLEFAPDGFNWGFWVAESIFLFIFLIELCMRLAAECPTPWRFFFHGWKPEWWGLFDFGVTILGCLDCWVVTPIMTMSASGGESPMSSFTVLRVFRLIRLARLIRVLRMFNELVILVQTLGNSIRAVGWMSLLLGMIIYTGSIICVILLGEPHKGNEEIDKYFGTLGDALFSHFCVVTLEGWPDIALAAMQTSPIWALYFVAMITLTNFALVNLMVGVIVERIITFSQEQEHELSAFVAESEQFRITLKSLFESSDYDQNGEVTKAEIRELMEKSETHEIMTAFGINLDIPAKTLHTIMDVADDGPSSFEEFFIACMRLCGSKAGGIHSIFVQHDICETRRALTERLSKLEAHCSSQAPATVSYGARSQGFTATSSPDVQQASPEDCITELLDRMDRFGQVQLQICAEIEALKDPEGRGRSGNETSSPLLSRGPTLRDKSPREVGSCCVVDTLFCRRKEPSEPSREGSRDRRDQNSPDRGREGSRSIKSAKQTRKEFEAEFMKTKK